MPASSPYPVPQSTSNLTSSQHFVTAPPAIVICGVADATDRFAPALRASFAVTVASTPAEATAFLARTPPALVVTRLAADDPAGLALCVKAKQCSTPVTVLVTTTDPATVPDALIAGCDGVLLEPFAPNLLYARIGRLMRERAANSKLYARDSSTHPAHVPAYAARGTNRFWPGEVCTSCGVSGITSFEFSGRRRAWYACTRCRSVWLARRLEE